MKKKKERETKNRKDFIDVLMSMTDDELNKYIKEKGKPPKVCEMCRIIK